jgi:asparagine synthase (glutamine-hydrolysing)
MASICGILGSSDKSALDAMAAALSHRGKPKHRASGSAYAVAASHGLEQRICLVDGTPLDASDEPLSLAETAQLCANARNPAALALRGAFACAVQRPGGGWWLIRDRLGRKPLYYAQTPQGVFFASELKALLASGAVPRRLNLQSVDRYLTLNCVPGPETILQDVYRVPPGQVVEINGKAPASTRFVGFQYGTLHINRERAAEGLYDRLHAAVKRAPSSVILLSSGIDCAALAALKPSAPALFVGVERAWQNEKRLAKESAKRLHLTLEYETARRLNESSFTQTVACLDEPLADASVFPLWLILEQAAHHGTELMSGHGADEILGGYPRYRFLQKAQDARTLVPVSLLSSMLPSLPPNSFVRRGSRYLAAINDEVQSYLNLLSIFDDGERADLYTETMIAALHERGGTEAIMRSHFTEGDLTRNILALDLNVGLPDVMLTKCDRIAAAHGLTLGLPYLDDAVLDYVMTLSPETKYGVRSKPLLRMAMRGVLPQRVRLRARRGFRIPQDGRLVGLFDHLARQIITPERVDATGLFKWQHVEHVLRASTHNLYRRRQFWALLMFFAWYREVMEA